MIKYHKKEHSFTNVDSRSLGMGGQRDWRSCKKDAQSRFIGLEPFCGLTRNHIRFLFQQWDTNKGTSSWPYLGQSNIVKITQFHNYNLHIKIVVIVLTSNITSAVASVICVIKRFSFLILDEKFIYVMFIYILL